MLTGRDVRDAATGREHTPDVLVAEHKWQPRGMVSLIDGDISAANAGRFDGDDDPSGKGLRYRPILDAKI